MNATEATTTTANITADTATRLRTPIASLWRATLRISLIVFSCAAAGWALFNLQASWNESRLLAVTARIMAGDAFKADTLRELEPLMVAASEAKYPKPDLLRSVAIIRLRQAELDVEAGGDVSGNKRFEKAEPAIRTALKAAPTDSFLWFGLAWLTRARDGLNDPVLSYLRLSYQTGEHEGWIAIHRNALSVSIFGSLPADLQVKTLQEFRNLVESNYISAAADIVTGPGWAQQDRLLSQLEEVPVDVKLQLARAIVDLGYDIMVPGIERQASRPWK